MNTPKQHRPIRSFVRREGRLTSSQEKALTDHWATYGVEAGSDPIDLTRLFGRQNKRVLEIGFGNGDSLATQATAYPDTDFLGIEVHRPGVGHLLIKIEEFGLTNIRISQSDAIDVLQEQISETSVDTLQLFFPDPWPKKKHHKRRIVQRDFVELVASRLVAGGVFHVATDWGPYAEYIDEVMQASVDLFRDVSLPNHQRPDYRPMTKFEKRGLKKGHGVWDLIYKKI